MKKVIFVGQAMPKAKRDIHDWPTLNAWLYSIRITHKDIVENFLYTALVDYFPGSINGSHIVPTSEEIDKERPRLHKNIKEFNPDIVVPIGKLSISYCLNQEVELKEIIGKKFEVDPYAAIGRELIVIPLPHPSGASTWHRMPKNKILLERALNTLKLNLGT